MWIALQQVVYNEETTVDKRNPTTKEGLSGHNYTVLVDNTSKYWWTNHIPEQSATDCFNLKTYVTFLSHDHNNYRALKYISIIFVSFMIDVWTHSEYFTFFIYSVHFLDTSRTSLLQNTIRQRQTLLLLSLLYEHWDLRNNYRIEWYIFKTTHMFKHYKNSRLASYTNKFKYWYFV